MNSLAHQYSEFALYPFQKTPPLCFHLHAWPGMVFFGSSSELYFFFFFIHQSWLVKEMLNSLTWALPDHSHSSPETSESCWCSPANLRRTGWGTFRISVHCGAVRYQVFSSCRTLWDSVDNMTMINTPCPTKIPCKQTNKFSTGYFYKCSSKKDDNYSAV